MSLELPYKVFIDYCFITAATVFSTAKRKFLNLIWNMNHQKWEERDCLYKMAVITFKYAGIMQYRILREKLGLLVPLKFVFTIIYVHSLLL